MSKENTRVKEDTRVYESDEIIVYWKPAICQHAGVCVKGSPRVFEVGRKPWVILENDTADNVAGVLDGCPSGALSYERK